MIKNLKYRFSCFFTAGKIRACCAVVLAIITFAAATMLNLSVNTVTVFDGENTPLTGVHALSVGQEIRIRFANGTASAVVGEIRESE